MAGQLQSPAGPDGILGEILLSGGSFASEVNTPEEQDVSKMVNGMLDKSKRFKATWSKDYDRWWNLWESNHYKGRKSHTLSQAIVNQIWSAVETFIAHITDAVPDPITRARSPEYTKKAQVLTKWLRYECEANDIEQQLDHPVRSAAVCGIGWFGVEWDESLLGSRGDVAIIPIDEKFMFPAPYARNLKECEFVIEARNVPRDWVVRSYQKGELVPPGPTDGSLTNTRAYVDQHGRIDTTSPNLAQFTTTDGSSSRWTSSNSGLNMKKTDLVTLVKAYIRQSDGSMRLVVMANNVILQDGPSPYEDDDFPYVVVNLLPTMDTIAGRGLVQFIEGLQDVLDNTLSYLLDQQRFCSDPMLVVDAVNLEEGQLIDNSPGSVLPNVSPNGVGYSWLQAPGFNQAWLQIHEVITNYMDSVLGRVEVLKGEHPAGVDTLGGLEVIRDEANVRLRKHIKWVKASLKRMHLLIISRLRQFAKDRRIFRIDGQFGRDEFVEVNPTTGVSPDGELQQDFTIPEEAEFEVVFGKEAPGGRQARIELALQLASTPAEDGLPMVDRQYVLEQSEIEEAPEIMTRLAQMQQMQAQAAQQQAMTESGQMPPPGQEISTPADAVSSLFGNE